MDAANTIILLTGTLLFGSLLLSMASVRLGFPLLLIFLLVGMLAGEDGPGGIAFDDFQFAFLVGNLALAIILLDGGLRTHVRSFRVALKPALSLATLGVILTAGAVAAFAALLLDLDWRLALLLGAIVGSTDAAAVFSLLGQSKARLNERVEATLEIESGSNDPMAIFLVILMVGWLQQDTSPTGTYLVTSFVQQLGVGVLGGVCGGYLLSRLLQQVRLVEGLYALLVASGGLALFAAINKLGGSGFLAIYLAGLMIANRRTHATEHVLRVMDGLAWLAQAAMFLVLGLLVSPLRMLDDILVALLIAVFLILVARPLAVVISLLPFRFPKRELGFISWVGLRGAVPIVLAVFPVVVGLEYAQLLFNVTFAVVLVSLVVQGTSINLAARLFRVQVPMRGEPLDRHELDLPLSAQLELVQMRVEAGSRGAGEPVLALLQDIYGAEGAAMALVRADQLLQVTPESRLAPDDVLLVLLPVASYGQLVPWLTRLPSEGPLAAQSFFGEFVLDGAAQVADVAAVYDVQVSDAELPLSLAALVSRRLNRPLVVGDRIKLGAVSITVREIEDGQARKLGLKLQQ